MTNGSCLYFTGKIVNIETGNRFGHSVCHPYKHKSTNIAPEINFTLSYITICNKKTGRARQCWHRDLLHQELLHQELFIYSKCDLKFRNVVNTKLSALWTPILYKTNIQINATRDLRQLFTKCDHHLITNTSKNISSNLHKKWHPIYTQRDLQFTRTATLNFNKICPRIFTKCDLQFTLMWSIIFNCFLYNFPSHHHTDLHPALRVNSALPSPIISSV